MTTIVQLIQQLDEWLRTHRSAYYEFLQPPLTDLQIADFESFVGVALPADLKTLYRWKGGQTGISPEPLYDGRTFMQMREIQEGMRSNNELREMGIFDEENWWRPYWVPFLTDGGGNFLCIDLEGSFGGKKGQLITFWSERADRDIEYPDIPSFISSLLEGFKAALQRGALPDYIPIPYPSGYPIKNRAT